MFNVISLVFHLLENVFKTNFKVIALIIQQLRPKQNLNYILFKIILIMLSVG